MPKTVTTAVIILTIAGLLLLNLSCNPATVIEVISLICDILSLFANTSVDLAQDVVQVLDMGTYGDVVPVFESSLALQNRQALRINVVPGKYALEIRFPDNAIPQIFLRPLPGEGEISWEIQEGKVVYSLSPQVSTEIFITERNRQSVELEVVLQSRERR